MRILISAGEASGDLYASELAAELKRARPDLSFFGCTGPRMRAAGVETVVDAASLGVVGLVEVVRHIPRIYGEFRKLVRAAEARRPDLAILTDSPDFHLRLAKKLKAAGVPVVYLIAPQVWAWRQDRIPMMRRTLDRLLCIFPFEEAFFRRHGMDARYIGHPLTRIVRTTEPREAFLTRLGLNPAVPLITLLPGSRVGETGRHLPVLLKTVAELRQQKDLQFLWATPPGFSAHAGAEHFRERVRAASIQWIEGDTWNAIGHADLALAASGTVTVETAILGTPMITFYRVTSLSWLMGKLLVRVPYYSMPNLIANRKIVPEWMQEQMTPQTLAHAALQLLEQPQERAAMRRDLAEVVAQLHSPAPPMESAARIVLELLKEGSQ
jgi:lipid-A-disaccharide synthase